MQGFEVETRVWDPETGRKRRSITERVREPGRVRLANRHGAPLGLLALTAAGATRIVDPRTGETRHRLGARVVAVSPDGRWLIRRTGGALVLAPLAGSGPAQRLGPSETVAFSADGSHVAWAVEATVHVRRLPAGPTRRVVLSRPPEHLYLDGRGSRLLALDAYGASLHDERGRAVPLRPAPPEGRLRDAAFAPDGRLALVDRRTAVWLYGRDGRRRHHWRVGARGAFTRVASCAFSHDGARLAVTVAHGLGLWDVRAAPRRLDDADAPLEPPEVAVSPDGRWLAVGEPILGRVALHDLARRRRVWRVPVGPVGSLRFEGGALRVALGSPGDPVSCLLALADGKTLARRVSTRRERAHGWQLDWEGGPGPRLRREGGGPARQLPAGDYAILDARTLARLHGGALWLMPLGRGGLSRRVALPTALRTGHRLLAGRAFVDIEPAEIDGPVWRYELASGRLWPLPPHDDTADDAERPSDRYALEDDDGPRALVPTARGPDVVGVHLVVDDVARLGLPVGRLGTVARWRHALGSDGGLLRLDRREATLDYLRGTRRLRLPLTRAARAAVRNPEREVLLSAGYHLEIVVAPYTDDRVHLRFDRRTGAGTIVTESPEVETATTGHGWHVQREAGRYRLVREPDLEEWPLPPGDYVVVDAARLLRVDLAGWAVELIGTADRRRIARWGLPGERRAIDSAYADISPDGRHALLSLWSDADRRAVRVPLDLARRRCGEPLTLDSAIASWLPGCVLIDTDHRLIGWSLSTGRICIDEAGIQLMRAASSADGRRVAVSLHDTRVAIFELAGK